MINDLNNICGDEYPLLLRLLESNKTDDTNFIKIMLHAWNNSFQYIKKREFTGLHLPSVCSNKETVCFYNSYDLRVYDMTSKKLVKSISSKIGEKIKFANLFDFLVVSMGGEINFHTKNGIYLYSIPDPLVETPKIFSCGNYVVLDYKYEFYVVDPYFKGVHKMKKKLKYSLLGYSSEYNFINYKDTLTVAQTSRKTVRDGVKTITLSHMFAVKSGRKIVYFTTRDFGKKPKKTKTLYKVFFKELDDEMILQPGTGEFFKLSDVNGDIVCSSLKAQGKEDSKYIGTYEYNDVRVSIMATKKTILHCRDHGDKLEIICSSEIGGKNIDVNYVNNKIYTISGHHLTVFDMDKLTIKGVYIDNILNPNIVAVEVIEDKIIILSQDSKTQCVNVDHVIDSSNENIDEAI